MMEEGFLINHQNDIEDRRITVCVILSTFVAVCSTFSYGCASTVVQGFISKNRMPRFEPDLKANSVYKMKKFSLIDPKKLFKVSDYKQTICFTDQTTFDEVEPEGIHIPFQHFRLREFNDFAAIADRNENLYDVIGHIRVVDGENIQYPHTTDEGHQNEEGVKKGITVHLQLKDGITVRVRLWDKIAATFRKRFNKSATKPTVLFLTTVNPKTYRGAMNLNSTSATRVFLDDNIDETAQYMTWLGQKGETAFTVKNSAKVTKVETITLREIHDYIAKKSDKEASFICTVKIVDLLQQYGWHYISCSSCNTKVHQIGTSLRCYVCKQTNIVGILRYRFELFVHDNDDEATFVILDSVGTVFTGMTAAELNSLQRNGDKSEDKPIPQRLLDLIGRTCKFQVEITKYNFKASRQTITVSKVLENDIAGENPVLVDLAAEMLDAKKDVEPSRTKKKANSSDEMPVPEKNKEKRLRIN